MQKVLRMQKYKHQALSIQNTCRTLLAFKAHAKCFQHAKLLTQIAKYLKDMQKVISLQHFKQ